MKIPQENLVFDINPLKGTLKDWSPSGNDAAQASDSILKTHEGWGSVPTEGTLSIAHDASHNVSELAFMICADLWRAQGAGDRMLYKAGAYDFYFASSTTIAFSDGTTAYSFSGSYDYVGAKTIGVRKSAGASKAELWIDGEFIVVAGGNTNLGTSSNTLYIGNAVGVANQLDVPITSAVMYGDSSVDMTQLHKALVKRKTPFKSKRNSETQPSVGPTDSGMAENAVIVGGKTIDQGPNKYNGTIYSDIAATQPAGMSPGKTPWGEPCLLNQKGTEAHLNYGAAANTAFATSDSVFGYARWFKCSSAGSQMLISRSGNYFLQKLTVGQLQLSMGSGAWLTTTSPIRDDVWQLYSFFVDEDFEYIYVDGEFIAKNPRTGTPGAGTLREGQYVIPGFDIDGGIGPRVFYKEFANLAQYEAELKQEWNRVADKVVYYEDFSDAYVMQSAISGAGLPIPGTEWRVNTTSGQIVDGPNRGEKSITGAAVGAIIETPNIDHSFGRFIYEFKSVAGSRNRFNLLEGAVFSILDGGGTNATLSHITSAGGVVFSMATGSLTDGNHQVVLDKKANAATNNLSIYLNGELAAAATGSNPCTDLTNVKGVRQLAPYGATKGHRLIQLFGVPLT